MKNRLFTATAMVALLAMPTLASANDQGWYVRGNVGYGIVDDLSITGGLSGDVQGEGNAIGSIGLGYDFGNNWRLELDGAQLWDDLGSVDGLPSSYAKLRTTTGMINALYDFSDFGRVTPYVGAGIGMAELDFNAAAHNDPRHPQTIDTNACSDVACAVSDTDRSLAWQLIAGLGVDLANNFVWDTQYRYTNVANGTNYLGSAGINGASGHIDAALNSANIHSLMTGFRYKFGGAASSRSSAMHTTQTASHISAADRSYKCLNGTMVSRISQCKATAPVPAPTQFTTCSDGTRVVAGSACPIVQQVSRSVQCSDGTLVSDASQCAPTRVLTCWDGSVVSNAASCPTQRATVQCSDGSMVTDAAYCNTRTVISSAYNSCGPSNVAIFNVPATAAKSITRLGTLPEFGNSHGLTSSQFYEKLQARYANNKFDRQYLNYLFKSMGYSNGFKDAHAGLFSEDLLPVGTTGMLGFGKYHGYAFSVLNTSDKDREAFRIHGANGKIVHFMKTCGNYMYACQ